MLRRRVRGVGACYRSARPLMKLRCGAHRRMGFDMGDLQA